MSKTPNPLLSISECEQVRLQENVRRLGSTINLFDIVLQLYSKLAVLLFASRLGFYAPFFVVVNCLYSNRHQLMIGTLSLLRDHNRESHYNLRSTIESAAFAVHTLKNPDFAKLWCNARSSSSAFNRYKSKYPLSALVTAMENGQLDSTYEWCNKKVHPTMFAFEGAAKWDSSQATQMPARFEYEFKTFDTESVSVVIDSFLYQMLVHIEALASIGCQLSDTSPHFDMTNWLMAVVDARDVHKAEYAKWQPIIDNDPIFARK